MQLVLITAGMVNTDAGQLLKSMQKLNDRGSRPGGTDNDWTTNYRLLEI
jgi:hypothetical protein